MAANTRLAGDPRKALVYSLQKIEILEELYGNNEAEYIDVNNQLGVIYQELGEHEKALEIFQQGQLLILKAGDDYAIDNYEMLRNLMQNEALSEANLGLIDEAIEDYQILYDIYRETDPDHLGYFLLLNNMGSFYVKQEKYHLGLFYMNTAYQWCLDHGHTDDWPFALINMNIGKSLTNIGQDEIAIKNNLEALKILEQTTGKKGKKYISALNVYGLNVLHLGNPVKADSIYKQLMELQKALDQFAENILDQRFNHAMIKIALGEYELAKELIMEQSDLSL